MIMMLYRLGLGLDRSSARNDGCQGKYVAVHGVSSGIEIHLASAAQIGT
jgi:hypothetical protein